jgi:hypothetical protein
MILRKEKPESVAVVRRCHALGVTLPMIETLLEQYPKDRLERQLAWLPARKPRDPAALFVRAVQGDWAQPAQYDPKETKETWERWLENVAGDKGRGRTKDKNKRVEEEKGIGERGVAGARREEYRVEVPGTGLDMQQVWRRALHELEMQMTRVTFDTWLRGSQAVGVRENGVVVQVRDGYAVEWLQTRLLVAIRRTLAGIAGQQLEVYFEVA